MAAKVRISVMVSRSLRRHLEESREASGRTLTAEVEARLRHSLKARESDDLLLLRLDDGLMGHLQALAAGGFMGPIEDTTIYLIRNGIIEYLGNKNLREMIVPHLPKRFRESFPEAARVYEHLAGKRKGGP